MTKQELRKTYLSKRRSLTAEIWQLLNTELTGRFFNDIDLTTVSVIHSFLSISKNKEPDTWPLIYQIQERYPSIRISLPKIDVNTGTLENFYFENSGQLKVNSLGIPEPEYGNPTATSDIDIVIVPLLCFDTKGNRVGYGKGYYDRFLPQCKPGCRKIGLSFFEPVERIVDANHLDVALDVCVTPDKTYFF